MTYLLCHDSPICHDMLSILPPTYDDHMSLLWVEEEAHTVLHPHVHSVLHEKKKHTGTRENSTLGPTVMFHDETTGTYIRHEGMKAIQFLHNYTLHQQKNRLEKHKANAVAHIPLIQHGNRNVDRILDIHTMIKQTAGPSSIKEIIKSTAKVELQKMYSTLRESHIPISNVHNK